MAAGLGDLLDQVGAQFVGDRAQVLFRELAQVGGNMNSGKARVALRIDHFGGVWPDGADDKSVIVPPSRRGGKARAECLPRRPLSRLSVPSFPG